MSFYPLIRTIIYFKAIIKPIWEKNSGTNLGRWIYPNSHSFPSLFWFIQENGSSPSGELYWNTGWKPYWLFKVVRKVNWLIEAIAYICIEISDDKSKSGFKTIMIKKKAIDLKKRQNKEEIEEAVLILIPVCRLWVWWERKVHLMP